MQFKKYNSRSIFNLLIISIVMFLAGCSIKNESISVSKKPIPKQTVNSDFTHSHPSNPCTEALTHSHSYTTKDHQHSYDCESTNEYVKNGHIHPATGKYPKRRHVHPNGANKHTHIKE